MRSVYTALCVAAIVCTTIVIAVLSLPLSYSRGGAPKRHLDIDVEVPSGHDKYLIVSVYSMIFTPDSGVYSEKMVLIEAVKKIRKLNSGRGWLASFPVAKSSKTNDYKYAALIIVRIGPNAINHRDRAAPIGWPNIGGGVVLSVGDLLDEAADAGILIEHARYYSKPLTFKSTSDETLPFPPFGERD